MESEIPLPGKTLEIRGQIRISCGDTRFSVDFQRDRTLVDFPSFSRLLRMKSEIDSLRQSISRLPPLPVTRSVEKAIARPSITFDQPEFRLTVRGRSVGKLDFQGGGVQFHLTPFDFITKRMS